MNQGHRYIDTVINQLSEVEDKWFAVYTKYKCEKYVAAQLNKKNIETYVPLLPKTKRYTRKIKSYEVPLINCYVFVCINKAQYLPILETEYVMKFLRQGKDLIAIPQEEIDILKRVSGDISEISNSANTQFGPGEEVEVISGHLTGLKGKIISQQSKKSFIIDLTTIGFQLRINIDQQLLRPIHIKQVIY